MKKGYFERDIPFSIETHCLNILLEINKSDFERRERFA